MGSRRNILIIVSSSLVVVLFVLAGILLYRGWASYAEAERNLASSKDELERLFAKNPFPSAPNVAEERTNLAVLNDELAGLLAKMAEGQVEPVEQSPSRFVSQFWETRKELLARARDGGTAINEGFAFGFNQQMSGNPPAPKDVPRLTQQLTIVRNLVEILLDAKITELRGVGREEFEELVTETPEDRNPAASGRSRDRRKTDAGSTVLNMVQPDAGLVGPAALYGKWHLAFQFTAKERVVCEILNRLAKAQLFVVVTRLQLINDEKGFVAPTKTAPPQPAAGGAKDETAAAEVVPREMRIVYGRDIPMQVTLELDVYQFRKLPAAKARTQTES